MKKAPIEEKESYKWLKIFSRVAEVKKRLPQTILVGIGDREANVYDLFDMVQRDPTGPKLLILALQPRKKIDGTPVWDSLLSLSPDGEILLQVPRHHSRASGETMLEIRFSKIEPAPPTKRKKELVPVVLWAVAERNPHAGVEPLSWLLLTPMPVETMEQALEKVEWYTKPWGIEVFHRTLKSGCKIEDRQLGNDHQIDASLAIDLVVAWRLFHLAKMGRENPDVHWCSTGTRLRGAQLVGIALSTIYRSKVYKEWRDEKKRDVSQFSARRVWRLF